MSIASVWVTAFAEAIVNERKALNAVGITPTVIYLGEDEYNKFMAEIFAVHLMIGKTDVTYGGLPVYKVNTETHLKVA